MCTIKYKGIPVSPGIAIGKAYIHASDEFLLREDSVTAPEVEGQIAKLHQAIEASAAQLSAVITAAREMGESEKTEILEAQIAMLEDEEFTGEIANKIATDFMFAETAVQKISDRYMKIFADMDDEYLRERATDIRDIGARIIRNILGIQPRSLSEMPENTILIARDLTPSDTAQIDPKTVKAFCTEVGGRTSHTAILARMLGIPAIVGISDMLTGLQAGDSLIVDGDAGMLSVNPTPEELTHYEKEASRYAAQQEKLHALKDLPPETADGERRLILAANISSAADCAAALDQGAEGVGLFRTEVLYMGDRLPTEDLQFDTYKKVAETMAPHPVVIRTFDIGGDKTTPCLHIPKEENPFLGWRAIRICFSETELFKTQLKAILRASCYGKIHIMYPMISGIEDLRHANVLLQEAKDELSQAQIPYDEQIQTGIMIEIPSAAVCADILIKEADFFSIGTNDLIQYTLAVDRVNERVSNLYQPLHPAVLRLIKHVIDVSHTAGKWTGMCGEMAGDAAITPLLVGLGLDEFSMSSSSVPLVKNEIRNMSLREAEEIARQVMALENVEEIRGLLQNRVQEVENC